ncbi:hypothetical protein AAP_02674 [Ascosphaera apis ARSEF 7405]|uniref:Uncharacterized protein n=1 Tax=Ascosphaera apis ARSEF 7405 TaxID=392613 RepID=A0A167ZX87_9EURO|nr:hypothetical protein AAP_02674 [Ascosphaera apis ARSEF 7405]
MSYQQSNASLQSLSQVRSRPQSQIQNVQRRQSRRGSLYRPFSRISTAQHVSTPRSDPDSHRLLVENLPDLEQYINDCLIASQAFLEETSAKRSSSVPRPPRIGTPSRQNSPSPSVRKQAQPRYYAQINKDSSSSAVSQGSSLSVEALSPTYSSNSSNATSPQSRPCSGDSFSGVDDMDSPLAPPPTIGMMSEQGSRSDPALRPRAMSNDSSVGMSRRPSFFSSGNGGSNGAVRRRGTLMKQKWNASQPVMRQSAMQQSSSPLRSSALQADNAPASQTTRPSSPQKKRKGFFRLFRRDPK